MIKILNLNDAKYSDDWDQIMSVAQRLTLGPDKLLRIEPVEALASLRGEHRGLGQTLLPANQEMVFDQIQGNAMESAVEIDPKLSDVWLCPPERAMMKRGEETLKLRVFIDHSVVEVLVNSRRYLAMRVYPGRKDSVGVSLRAQGQDAVLKGLDAWPMSSVWHE